jgi:TonB-linked SusC/RagA family outer membrane protein
MNDHLKYCRNVFLLTTRVLPIITFLCFFLSYSINAQVVYVSGHVTTEEGEKLAGVTIRIEGTTQGTITDMDGNYSIVVPGSDATLAFSFIGYVKQVIRVGDQSEINIILSQDVMVLDDVVVMGYSTQSVRNVSGSVSKVEPKDLNNIPSNNVANQLQGLAPGVFVLNTSRPGGPSEVRIRGFTTINNNRPLYVIDGNPTMHGYRFINPRDIETFQVLKDASAASIYGARASNGVILITTKKPKIGDPQFTFDSYIGVQTVPKTFPELLDPYEKLEIEKRTGCTDCPDTSLYVLSDGTWGMPDYLIPRGYTYDLDGPLDVSDYEYNDPQKRYTQANHEGTDWIDEIFNPALWQNYDFSFSYGNEKGGIMVSLGYYNQNGILKHNDFRKYTFRINGNLNLGKRVRFGTNLGFTFEEGMIGYTNSNSPYQYGALSRALLMYEIFPVYDVDGNFSGMNGAGADVGFSYFNRYGVENPLGWLERIAQHNKENWYNLMASFFIEADLVDGLMFKSNFSPTIRALPLYKSFDYDYPDDPVDESDVIINPFYLNGSLTQRTRNIYNWTWYNTLTYNKSFNDKHNLKVLLGIESIHNKYIFTEQTSSGYASADPDYRELDNGQKIEISEGNTEEWALFSIFTRIDYDFSGKYLFSATLRRDGSSRFNPENRYGYFPALSVAWRISDENFMKGLGFINDLKIRGSWGQTGNQEIKTDRILDQYIYNSIMASYSITGDNTDEEVGLAPVIIGNPFIKWETTTTTDIGVDMTLFSNQLSAGFNWYNRKTTDILQEAPSSTLLGKSILGNSYKNLDTMLNKGIDVYIMYHSSAAKNFRWSAGINFSRYKNEIIYVFDEETLGRGKAYWMGQISWRQFVLTSASKKGNPIASFSGLQIEGIFQDEEEVRNSADHSEIHGTGDPEELVGLWKYEDADSSGIIDAHDKKILGSPHPEFVVGIPISMNYKKFDLNVFFYGAFGHQLNNQTNSHNQRKMLEGWGMPGVDNSQTIIPITCRIPYYSTSYTVEDASFVRLRQITLGYTFDTKNWKYIRNFRVYVQVTNLFTITNYTGMDPEISVNTEDDLEMGTDYSQYPPPTSYLVGFNMAF